MRFPPSEKPDLLRFGRTALLQSAVGTDLGNGRTPLRIEEKGI